MTDEADEPGADVDVTLIDEMLAMTVEDRLRQNDRMARAVAELREAFLISRGTGVKAMTDECDAPVCSELPGANGPCPKCERPRQLKPNMFYWRGRHFAGLVCEACNSLWEDPADPFVAQVVDASHGQEDDRTLHASHDEPERTVHRGPPVGPDEWDCPCGHTPKRIEENCSRCDRRQSVWDPCEAAAVTARHALASDIGRGRR
jgi:hypothetical protein